MNPIEPIITRFEQISAIPRCTKNEAGLRAWLQEWAAGHGWVSQTDATGNPVIHLPPTPGYEDRPGIVLQGHLDMVCQKTGGSTHDFTRDPIRVLRDGDWLKADGTTLGADNGIAVALMMALAEDETVRHPRLELLLTVEEEVGLVGADNLDPALIQAKTLINLDSEQEGVLIVGCAGSANIYITLPVTWEPQSPAETAFEIQVTGLRGGHSGEDIHKHRASANQLIARVLEFVQRDVPLRLSALQGGTVRNAIPREAAAVFVCPKDQAAACRDRFDEIARAIRAEHARTEPRISLSCAEKGGEPLNAIGAAETVTGIRMLVSLPSGVQALSAEIPGFVETSSNVGVVELKEDGLFVISSHRSSVYTRLVEKIHAVEALAWMAGAETTRSKTMEPWQPDMDSPLLKKCIGTYEGLFGTKPKVELIHAGLECGLISRRVEGMDAISLGPTLENPHSPEERLYVPSLPKVWEYLRALLAG